jgi:hypothetical protein
MTGADNSDSLFKESPAMKRLKKMDMKWFNSSSKRKRKMKTKKKPKVIPKGFIWDPKAKELVDVRCNNPKLRKLCRESIRVDKPAICISPFFVIESKNRKKRKGRQ